MQSDIKMQKLFRISSENDYSEVYFCRKCFCGQRFKITIQVFRILFSRSSRRKVFYKNRCSAKSSSVIQQYCSCSQNSGKMSEKEFIFSKISVLQPATKKEPLHRYFSRVFEKNIRRVILQSISWRLRLHFKTASLSKDQVK